MTTPEKPITTAPVISKANWFWTLIALGIPLVGIAFCLYWFFNRDTNPNKRNFAAAVLILTLITLAFYVLVVVWSASLIPDIPFDMDSSHSSSSSQQQSGGTAL